MAKITGSDISGMVGPVVFLKLNGRGVVRKAPKERPKNGWSDGQKMYREKISRLGTFWMRSVHGDIKHVFELAAIKMTAYNLFLKTNLAAFSTDGTRVDKEWLHLSAGKLPLSHQLKAGRIAGDPEKVEVEWQNDSNIGPARQKDELMMVIAHEGKFTAPIATGAFRNEQTAVIQLP
jgi:hypothetical protein